MVIVAALPFGIVDDLVDQGGVLWLLGGGDALGLVLPNSFVRVSSLDVVASPSVPERG